MSARLTLGFLGAGKMASALAKGFIRAGLVGPKQVIASDPIDSARASFAKETGAKTTAFNPDVARFADVLILAVKPDQAAGGHGPRGAAREARAVREAAVRPAGADGADRERAQRRAARSHERARAG